jgi:hypothetical protein
MVVEHKIENVCECCSFSMMALYQNLFCISKHNDFVVCNLRNFRGIYLKYVQYSVCCTSISIK